MKGLQTIIRNYLKDHEKRKKYFAVIMTLSIVVTFAVPMSLIMPAVSMTRDNSSIVADQLASYNADSGGEMLTNAAGEDGNVVDGIVYSPEKMSAITLLIGEGDSLSWAEGCTTAQDVVERAKEEYFLGIAYDFCAFIEGDFKPKAADAEGRVAVGGDIIFDQEGNEWNYQIGSGDYATGNALKNTTNYTGVTNYAHAIVNGKIINVNTASTGSGSKKFGSNNGDPGDYHTSGKGTDYSYTFFYKPEEDLFKRLVVGDINNSTHFEDKTPGVAYTTSHSHDYPGDCETDENGADKKHPYLGNVNELAQIYKQEQPLIDFQEMFNYLRKHSISLSKFKSTGTVEVKGNDRNELELTCPDGTEAGDTVYFNVPEWNYYKVSFNNVPTTTMKNDQGDDKIYPTCNLIVNCGGKEITFGTAADGEKLETYVNGEAVHAGNDMQNNFPASEKILYNFYEAEKIHIRESLNGTIFCPFADVDTEADNAGTSSAAGHLSGALIARSFEGYLEFGYRPYRGNSEILSLTSGYSVPVDKFIERTENGLAGVSFSAIDTDTRETVFSWVSNGETVYIPFPTAVDYSGETFYTTTTTITTTTTTTTTTAIVSEETSDETATTDDTENQSSQEDENAGETEQTEKHNDITDSDISDELQAQDIGTESEYITITKKYEISEILSPEGFFKSDTKYCVQIEENVDTSNTIANGSKGTFPTHVRTSFIISDENDAEITQWHFDITDTYAGNRISERIITVSDKNDDVIDTFTLNIPEKRIETIESLNSDVAGISLTKAGIINITSGKYYFDPDVMMIMPLPESNLKFENKPGLLFKKVDDSGKDVIGAAIKLLNEDETEISDQNIWNWDTTKNSFLIDVAKLIPDNTYIFRESKTPSKYEKAEDIYFKVNGTIIQYWTKGNESNPASIDITEVQSINMVDAEKYGAVPSLKKVHKKLNDDGTVSDDFEILKGATIELHAQNGDKICEWTNFTGEETSMKEVLAACGSTKYTENGYLKPGVYYLYETKIPACTDGEKHADPGKMYFTVTDDFKVVEGYESTKRLAEPTWNGNECPIKLQDGTVLNDSNANPIKNVVYVHIETDINFAQLYSSVGNDETGENNKFTFDNVNNPTDLEVFKIQHYNDPRPVYQYVEIRTSDGITYVYGTNPDQTPDSSDAFGDHTSKYLEVQNESLLQVENIRQGDTKDITVNKVWANDNDFKNLRQEVTYTLYSTTEELTDLSPESLKKLIDDNKTDIVIIPDKYTADDGTEKNQSTELKLSESNNWSQIIYGLPTKSDETDENGKKLNLNYFIIEDKVSSYTPLYTITGDTLTVTNTLETIELTAEKVWSNQTQTDVPKPDSLKLQLQIKKDNVWENLRLITLTGEGDSWTTTIKGLPTGKEYRIVENVVPNGWKCTSNNNAASVDTSMERYNKTLSITNEPRLASLIVHKIWNDNKDESIPDKVRVKVYRKILLPYPENQSPIDTQKDYARLLQYSLFFYDANMCGDNVNEDSGVTWREDCHTHDGDDILGGYHDAGDHVMFGLAQGYSASILNWGLYEFPDSYKTLGQTDHIKNVSDHFSDFINRCAQYDTNGDITKILVQKGNPVIDHKYWGTPEMQETKEQRNRTEPVTYTPIDENNNEKPETTHSQIYWSDDLPDGGGCADIAFEYAATLASAYVNAKEGHFGEAAKNDTKYDDYLDTAKKLYDFGIRNNTASKSQGENNCYNSRSIDDDKKWAATWLYLATKDNAYNMSSSFSVSDKGNYNISWDSVENAAALLYAGHVSKDTSGIVNALNGYVNGHSGYVFGSESGGWGNMRHNAAYQTSALVAAKYASGETKDNLTNWAKTQMNVILGNNTAKNANGDVGVCFITGFAKNSIQNPHYRATSKDDSSVVMKLKDDKAVIDDDLRVENILIGGLAGGWFSENQNSFEDRRSDYQQTEVACDYNACLTVAAAGLYEFYRTGNTYDIPNVFVKNSYNGKPKTEESTLTLQSLSSELPMLFMAQAKQVRSAGEDSNGNYESIESPEFKASIDIPNLNGDLKSITVIFTSNITDYISIEYQNETGGYMGNGGEYKSNTDTFSFSNIAAGCKKIKIGCNGNTSYDIKEIRFYYEPDNTFKVTPDKDNILVGEKVKLTVPDGLGTIDWGDAPVTQENGTWYYTAPDTAGSYTITGRVNGKTGTCQIEVENFKITESPVSVNENNEFTIKTNASVSEWTFDDSKIEYVSSNGNEHKFKAVDGASGNAAITAKHGGSSDTVNITVNPIAFTITPNTCDLPINEEVTLTANAPADWVSSDSGKVQIVSTSDDKKSCVVKALDGKDTSATITATRTANSSQTASATINIKPKNQWYTLAGDTISGSAENQNIIYKGNWENVTKIEFIDSNGKSLNDGGYIGSNNFGCTHYYVADGKQVGDHTHWYTQSDFPKVINLDKPQLITEIAFKGIKTWEGSFNIKEIRLHYVDVPKYTITSDKTELLPGETAVLTVKDADGNKINGINWTIPEGCGTIESNNDGTYIYTAGGHFGEKELTGEANGIKGKITLTTKTITANSPIKLRTGKTDVITLTGADNAEISYNVGDSSVASVDENGSVTANSIGETTVIIVCNGTETDCQVNIRVLDELTSSSKAVTMKPNSTVQLAVENAVGNVTWSLKDSSDSGIATVDPDTGLVTSKEKYGNTIIVAKDSDGSEIEFTVSVKDMAEVVVLPEGSELVGEFYDILKKDNWNLTIPNLPVTDENGRPYYYYIVEVDENGDPITDDNTLKSNGSVYIPVEYENGKVLDETNPTELSVENKKIGESMGELPSAGGEGTAKYYVTGIIIMCSAAAYYLIRRRRKRVEE